MRKRILFVDDQPLILAALRRSLRSMQAEWDLDFAQTGEEALAKLGAADPPFDAVVTDSLMPGMDGFQLLEEVTCRFPGTARLLFSGLDDQAKAARGVRLAHQFITKPCEPAQLITLVGNALRLAGAHASREIQTLVGAVERLPSPPRLYSELTAALASGAGPQALGAILEQDPAMTAQVLKITNSAFFGLRREIGTAREAAAYLGVETLRLLVLAGRVFGQGPPLATRSLSLSGLQRHSAAVADGARIIAGAEAAGRTFQETAFVGGMLHDIGILVLAGQYPETYDGPILEFLGRGKTLESAEQEAFGVTHAEVGTYLLSLWGLPSRILEVVSLHHHPGRHPDPGFTPALAVHAADALVGKAPGQPLFEPAELDQAALADAGLVGRLEVWKAALVDMGRPDARG